MFIMLVAISASSQTLPFAVRASWTAPISGSPAVEYELQLSINGGEFQTVALVPADQLYVDLTDLEYFTEYIAIIRAKDAQDRWGEWSDPSAEYMYDPGPPAAPSMPVLVGMEE